MKQKLYLFIFLFLFLGMSKKSAIPKNAEFSEFHPGWKCKEGYVQKRDECIDYKKPKNATMNIDGNTWSCKEGYYKYRNTCRKIQKK